MSSKPDTVSLEHRLDGWGFTRRDGHSPVWDGATSTWPFSSRTRGFIEAQPLILGVALKNAGGAYLFYDEDPEKWEMPGEWEELGLDLRRIPDGSDPEFLLRNYLYYGGWVLFAGALPRNLDDLPDHFRVSADELLDYMKAEGVEMLIGSFLDDCEWVVAIDPEATAHQ